MVHVRRFGGGTKPPPKRFFIRKGALAVNGLKGIRATEKRDCLILTVVGGITILASLCSAWNLESREDQLRRDAERAHT